MRLRLKFLERIHSGPRFRFQYVSLALLLVVLLTLKGPAWSFGQDVSVIDSPTVIWNEIDGGAFIMDVRTDREHFSGHLRGSVLVPYDEITDRQELLPSDKKAKVVVYCASGRRAAKAIATLRALGYSNATNAGGYDELAAERPSAVCDKTHRC